jgi:hypothetical protein
VHNVYNSLLQIIISDKLLSRYFFQRFFKVMILLIILLSALSTSFQMRGHSNDGNLLQKLVFEMGVNNLESLRIEGYC